MKNEIPGRQYGSGRIAFKAHLLSIQKDIEDGYPLTTVYEKHKDSLGISYSQFARHVQRYIQKKERLYSNKSELITEGVDTQSNKKNSEIRDTPFKEKYEFNPVAPDYSQFI